MSDTHKSNFSKNTGARLEKRGRKEGSTDSLNIPLAALIRHLPEGTVIPVRRKWVEAMEAMFNIRFEGNQEAPTVEKTEPEITREDLGTAAQAVARPRYTPVVEDL